MSDPTPNVAQPAINDMWATIHDPKFTLDQCIDLLRRYPDSIGIQYTLCQRIASYPMSELRFYVPELLQLLITVDTQSLALEETLKVLCSQDVHFSLLTFWYLQSFLQQLEAEPESIGFQTCKRLINELQYQLFNYFSRPGGPAASSSTGVVSRHDVNQNFRENLGPALILQTSLMAGITVPEATNYVAPIVKVQGKRVKTLVFEVLKDVKKSLTENLTRKNTMKNAMLGSASESGTKSESDFRRTKSVSYERERRRREVLANTRRSEDLELDMVESYAQINLPELRTVRLKNKRLHNQRSGASRMYGITGRTKTANDVVDHGRTNSIDAMISSMPNLTDALSAQGLDGSYASSIRNSFEYGSADEDDTSVVPQAARNVPLTTNQEVKLLQSNYFKNTTQFAIALQNISIRLSKVPRSGRLSTLKAELSILNKDLPCEVDIPILLPKNKKGKLHKICHIAVNESAVLNSAERVPYLLLIEYFSDGMDFDPSTMENRKLIDRLQESGEEKYRFDLAYQDSAKPSSNTSLLSSTSSLAVKEDSTAAAEDVPEESDLGDVSVVKLKNKLDDSTTIQFPTKSFLAGDIALDSEIRGMANAFKKQDLNQGSEHDKNVAVQMHIAGIMLQQLDSSNSTMPASQASQIRARILQSMQSMQNSFETTEDVDDAAGERKLSNDLKVAGLSYLGEDWNKKKERIRKQSKFGHYENWDLCSVIAKTGDDLTQEAFACQLIQSMAKSWYEDSIGVWTKRMRILVTSSNTGLVETITNALSVHSIKKSLTEHMLENDELKQGEFATLKDHFAKLFGEEESARYKMAQRNFAASLAAYSIICYVLQIKDRHNGNIMLDSEGHIIHIDFGFLLSNSPGSVGFESAPFKLTQEYIDVLGGLDSYYYKQFKELTKEAFKSVRRHVGRLVNMVELMQTDSSLPCFRAGDNTSVHLTQRLQLHLTDEEVDSFTENFLINKSLNSTYTRLYDQFQMLSQGIYP